ncbi:HNH endonuclease signature motif containing protein [Nocardioides sp. Kera G14]|uniref:HNH endonuclease signature motif containing protein n=1 Tax=Nocardioides sp. Kera G14 TaxID=2884264 RepID=UPI001D11B21F|nr:HNH endonuclease signature motif containing protein [Nocardioides sp. Kera G14]UDY22284.1 HNH endonuclease [Nocardioides sp. Kera G14]
MVCQAEGCDKPASWAEVHHLDPWSKGGKTDLNRMALLCRPDHRRIHSADYLHERLPDGTIRFSRRT